MYNRNGFSGKGGMSFILAQTLLFQLQTLNATLLSRINHLSLIYSEVKAIIDAKKDLEVSKEDQKKILEISANIEALRDCYEPFLDDVDAKQVGDMKRKTSEKLLDISQYYLLYTVEKYKLVDVNTLKDIQGVSWGENNVV